MRKINLIGRVLLSLLLLGILVACDGDADTEQIGAQAVPITKFHSVMLERGNLYVGDGTPSTALSGEDVYIEGTLETDGAIDADSTLDVAGITTLAGLLRTSFADLAVNDGDTITPTVTTYALDTSGPVTITLAASAAEGQLLILINDDANATIIAFTNLRTSTGGALTLAGANDIVVFIYQDAEWNELLIIANS